MGTDRLRAPAHATDSIDPPAAAARDNGTGRVVIPDLPYDRLFIGGQWVASENSDEQIAAVSPVTEKVIAHLPSGSSADIDRAVRAARRALDADGWRTSDVSERLRILAALRDELASAKEEAAALITHEMGCPITQSRSNQVGSPLSLLETYLAVGDRYRFSESRRSLNGATALVAKEPVGVVAAVIPWNMPLLSAMHKIAPALLAGCSLVLKPSPEAALSSYLLMRLLDSAGVPPGVVNMVPAARDASEHLVTHPDVDKVAFTGSSAVGRRIASLCGEEMRRVTLELGGKSAAILLEDADLDATVESLRMGSFRNSGQVCSLKTRVIVPKQKEEEVVERLIDLVGSMPLGDPAEEATQIGPVVSARQRSVVESYFDIARREGAKVAIGGRRPPDHSVGWYVEPTILVDVGPGMRVAQEEIFGPVVSVLAYRTEDEAIAIANDSRYGLSGSVFGEDLDRALNVARRMRTGTVEVNGSPTGPAAPVGGVKGSGIGREGGKEGLEAFLEPKSIGLPAAAVRRFAG